MKIENEFRKSCGRAPLRFVVYQPNETVRLEVRMENETVWLTQSQMAELRDDRVSIDVVG